MMKVPVYEEQVSPREVQIPEPNISAPPADAFGANVAQAQAQVGESMMRMGQVLASHMEKRLELDSKQAAFDAVLEYKTKMVDMLNSPDEIVDDKIKDPLTGNPVTYQRGLLNRDLNTARYNGGIAVQFNSLEPALRNSVLEKLKNNPLAYQTALQDIESQRLSAYEQVIKHQSNQDTKAKYQLADSMVTNAIASMNESTDPAVANGYIQTIEKGIKFRGDVLGWSGLDTDTLKDKKIKEGATEFALSVLRKKQSLDEANDSIDQLNLTDGMKSELKELMATKYKGIQSANEIAKKVEEAKSDTEVITRAAVNPDFLMTEDLSKSSISQEMQQAITSYRNEVKKYQAKPPQFSIERGQVVKTPGTPGKYEKGVSLEHLSRIRDLKAISDKTFAPYIEEIMKSYDQQTLSKTVANMLKDDKLGDPAHKLLVLKLAAMRGNQLKSVASKKNAEGVYEVAQADFDQYVPQATAAQDAVTAKVLDWAVNAGVPQVEALSDYVDRVASGKDPETAFQQTANDRLVRMFPKMSSTGATNLVHEAGRTRWVFAGESQFEPDKIFQNGKIVDNPNKGKKIEGSSK